MAEKENINEPPIDTVDTIIVKLKKIPDIKNQGELIDYLINEDSNWRQFFEKHPEAEIKRLLNNDEFNRKYNQMMKSRDSNYDSKKYEVFYIILLNEEIKIEQNIVDEVASFDSVVKAYKNPGTPNTTQQTVVNNYDCFDVDTLEQYYLKSRATYGGIGAEYAWNFAGAHGSWDNGGKINTIKVVDVEAGWDFLHQELEDSIPDKTDNKPIDTDLAQTNLPGGYDHGTAVMGILNGQKNPLKEGIVKDAWVHGSATFYINNRNQAVKNITQAIQVATLFLCPGDVMLLEVENDVGVFVEADEPNFLAIEDATTKGIIVIEPAGNGGEDLTRFTPQEDSGAIVVSSLNNNGNVHYSNWDKVRDSCWGPRVDVCAWGNCIDTLDSSSMDPYQLFGDTSGASAIIAGMVASIQGMRAALSKPKYTPIEMRNLLKSRCNGTDYSHLEIGTFPDFRCIVPMVRENFWGSCGCFWRCLFSR